MNQNPDLLARDNIDHALLRSCKIVQSYKQNKIAASLCDAIREYPSDTGPADYILFVNKIPVGVIEAKTLEEEVLVTIHEEQPTKYATAKLKYLISEKLSFVYESKGEVTRFADYRDPKPRSIPVFTFYRPETFEVWLRQPKTLRAGVCDIPALEPTGFRDCQVTAITNLEKSFRENRPKALVQMATGSGKTFTAITSIYRLLKFAKVKRILFLVTTRNVGEQVEREFKRFHPQDD